ncbi:transcriptional regulator [Candidatus Bathyarchaeota archaeon]|nr:transcriptional regulator [Candidatus Bathyarchaeota archaeon]
MDRDQAVGVLLCFGGILGILLYGWLVFLSEYAMLTLQLTGFIAVAAVLGILAWVGYTLATIPPSKPIEEKTEEPQPSKRE